MNKGVAGKPAKIEDYQPQYNCRFHPTNWWHEVGCSHMKWTKAQLQDALNKAKQSEAYRLHIMNHPEDMLTANDYAPQEQPTKELK